MAESWEKMYECQPLQFGSGPTLFVLPFLASTPVDLYRDRGCGCQCHAPASYDSVAPEEYVIEEAGMVQRTVVRFAVPQISFQNTAHRIFARQQVVEG